MTNSCQWRDSAHRGLDNTDTQTWSMGCRVLPDHNVTNAKLLFIVLTLVCSRLLVGGDDKKSLSTAALPERRARESSCDKNHECVFLSLPFSIVPTNGANFHQNFTK